MASPGPASLKDDRGSEPAGGRFVEYEAFIESQLNKTRSHVRSVDFVAGTMILLGGTLAYFFLAAMVDHWLVPGGLGFWGRLVLLAVYLIAASWWVATEIVPLLVKRINPLYAAQTIEQSRPTLKNTLLNFLMFRANPAGVHARVFQAIEEQAATKLSGVQVDSAVDRTRLIRLGYVLVGILAVWALYTMLAPKDLFQTVRRVAMPWADINAPTRTTIDEITPRDAQAFRGQQVIVAARVVGLPDDGKVILYYTTEDRQIVDRAVEMNRPADDHRHMAVLPAGDSSLQQTLSYRIEAGDAVTRAYTIEVVAAPTIVVQAVEYEYPEYTGLLAVRVEHQGDVKAIEGTRVTLEALANQDIETAQVDFDCDDTLDLRMKVDQQIARATFGLSLGDDRQTPEHRSYQVTFKNAAGQRNPQPVRHQIDVTRDLAPEIQLVSPRQDEIDLPLDAAVDLEVVASDPDFALSQVKLSAVKGEDRLLDETLLDEPWRGQFVKKFRFQPRKLGLETGDVVEYWAVAVDNKTPGPNSTETSRRRIRIVSPSGQQGDQDQLAQKEKSDRQKRPPGDDAPRGGDDNPPRDEQQSPDEPDSDVGRPADEKAQRGDDQPGGEDDQGSQDSQPTESQDGSDRSGQANSGDGTSGESGESQDQEDSKPGVPNDGTDDGEAIDRILKHRQEQNPNEKNPGERQEPGEQDQQDGEQQNRAGDEGQQGAQRQQSSDEEKGQSPREQQDSQKGSGADKPGGGQQSAGEQQGEKNPSDERGTEGGQKPGQPSKDQAQQQQGRQSTDKQPSGQQQRQDRGKSGDAKSTDDNSQSGDSEGAEKQQPGKGAAQKKSPGTQDRQSSDEEGRGQAEKQPSDEAKSPDQKNVEHQRGEGTDSQNAERKNDAQPNQQDPRRQTTRDNNTRQDGTPQDPSTKGQGAQSQDDPTRRPDQKPKQDDEQRPDAKGGEGEQQKGESGAGQSSKDDKGSPRPQESNQPRNKSQQPGSEEKDPQQDQPEQSPSIDKRESDSQGQEDGDRSGGGKKGGGQKANKPGTGGAGQNTAADEGAGKSDESGEGETADRAGDKRQADGQTGQSGSESGDGSRAKPATGENQRPGGDDAPQNSSDAPSSSSDENSGAGSQGSGSPNSTRAGSNSPPPKREWKPGVDHEDEANLDYARKATDLALSHLKDELAKDQPDPDLLDRLGWSRDDLEKFVKRWESMRRESQTPGDQGQTARRELDETLRSLGLRPRATTLKSNAGRDDRSQGYQESRRTTPPPEYTESFKAYTQGTARGGK